MLSRDAPGPGSGKRHPPVHTSPLLTPVRLDDITAPIDLRPGRRRPEPRAPRRRRRLSRRLLTIAVIGVLAAGSVVGDALRDPSQDPVPAKLAEWGRDHGLNFLITWLQEVQYQFSEPPVGGEPAGGVPQADGAVPAPDADRACRTPAPAAAVGHREAATPGRAVGDRGHPGRPPGGDGRLGAAGRQAHVVRGRGHAPRSGPRARPASARHPDPGGRWRASTSLAGPDQNQIAAVFNGGFKLSDPSNPGYYSEARRSPRWSTAPPAWCSTRTGPPTSAPGTGTCGCPRTWRASGRTSCRWSTTVRSTRTAPPAVRSSGAAPSGRRPTSTAPVSA